MSEPFPFTEPIEIQRSNPALVRLLLLAMRSAVEQVAAFHPELCQADIGEAHYEALRNFAYTVVEQKDKQGEYAKAAINREALRHMLKNLNDYLDSLVLPPIPEV